MMKNGVNMKPLRVMQANIFMMPPLKNIAVVNTGDCRQPGNTRGEDASCAVAVLPVALVACDRLLSILRLKVKVN